jgi:hypothetical protein
VPAAAAVVTATQKGESLAAKLASVSLVVVDPDELAVVTSRPQ